MLVNIPLTGDSIAFAIDSVTAGLQFSDYLQVVYLHKKNARAVSASNQRGIRGSANYGRIAYAECDKSNSGIGEWKFFYGKRLTCNGVLGMVRKTIKFIAA
jgi:hypothetical protein